jgi:hypothetical protein
MYGHPVTTNTKKSLYSALYFSPFSFPNIGVNLIQVIFSLLADWLGWKVGVISK